jgi:phage portal protein BeeE
MSLGFVKYTLQERLTTIEQELNRKLFRTAGTLVKFNVDELLRGDSAARAKFLRELVGGSQGPGIISADEARLTEGFAPMGGVAAELYDPRTAPGGPANAT